MSADIPAIEPQERVSPTSSRIYGVVCRKDPVKRIAFLRRRWSAKANAGKYKVYFVSDACREFDDLEVGYVVKFTLRPTPRGAHAEKVCWTGKKIFWQASKPQLDEARRTQSTPQPKPSAQQEAPPRGVTPTTSPPLQAAPQRPTTPTEDSVRREPGELGSAPSDTVPTALPAPANAHLSNAQQQGGDPSGVAHGSGTTPESTDSPSENPEGQPLQPLDSSQPAPDTHAAGVAAAADAQPATPPDRFRNGIIKDFAYFPSGFQCDIAELAGLAKHEAWNNEYGKQCYRYSHPSRTARTETDSQGPSY